MRFRKAWLVASKEFSVYRTKRYILYSVVILPLAFSLGLPAVISLSESRGGLPLAAVPVLLNAFSFFFIILASIIPTMLASYSFVGEKVERSLEPLLATPATDGELLLGKGLAAFLPSIGALGAGALLFMGVSDAVTRGILGYLYFPNWGFGIILLLAVPLASALSIEANVIISSMVSDVRAAQQVGSLVALPTGGVYVLAEVNFISLDVANLLLISALFVAIDLALLIVSRATFRREEILTSWK